MRKTMTAMLAVLLVLCLFATSGLAYTDKLNAPGTLPLVNESVDLVVGTPAVTTVTDYDNNHFTNYLREKTGVNIQVQLFDTTEWKTQFQLMTSSNETLPDTLWNFNLNSIERESYGSQGYFVDLLPMFEEHVLTYNFDNEAVTYLSETEKSITLKAGLSSNGALYGFPFWAVSVADPWSDGLLINNTFCEALGMDIPTTTEEFYEYLVAVKTQDPNGNGIADEIPLLGYSNSANGDFIITLLNSFLFYPSTYSGMALCATDDGEIYVPYQQEAFKDGMRYIAKLYAEGLISDLSFSLDRSGLVTMIDLSGDDPDVCGAVNSHRSYMFTNHNAAERRLDYTTIGPLVGPEGVAYAPTYAVEPTYRHFITLDCEYPEIAFSVLDFMTTAESTLTARYGRENEYWRYATEEEKAGGSSWANVGYEGVLYTSAGMKLAWNNETDEIWNITSITWQPMGFTALTPIVPTDDPIRQYNSSDWNNGVMARYGKAPKNLVGTLAYTAEEQAKLGTLQADIGTYVRESLTRFVIGEMDIDADWETFQANLSQMQIETVLECAQSAYDRAFK